MAFSGRFTAIVTVLGTVDKDLTDWETERGTFSLSQVIYMKVSSLKDLDMAKG